MTSGPIFVLMLIFVSSQAAVNLRQVGAQTVFQKDLQDLYDMAEFLHMFIREINEFNAPIQGRRIPVEIYSIRDKVNEASGKTTGQSPLSDADAKDVVGSLTSFVGESTHMLAVLIQRRDIYTLAGYFDAIKMSLLDLFQAVDSYSDSLTAIVPTQSSAAQQQFSSLKQAIQSAVDKYSEVPLGVKLTAQV